MKDGSFAARTAREQQRINFPIFLGVMWVQGGVRKPEEHGGAISSGNGVAVGDEASHTQATVAYHGRTARAAMQLFSRRRFHTAKPKRAAGTISHHMVRLSSVHPSQHCLSLQDIGRNGYTNVPWEALSTTREFLQLSQSQCFDGPMVPRNGKSSFNAIAIEMELKGFAGSMLLQLLLPGLWLLGCS